MSNDINIYSKSIHHLDIENETNEKVNISGTDNDFASYLNSMAKEVVNNSNDSRKFKFRSNTTEVISQIKSILDDNGSSEELNNISKRLLNTEVDAQDKYSRITNIQKGSLLQALFKIDNEKYFIITKVDHNTFLDEVDLKKRIGLPFESYVLKACIIKIIDNEINNIDVFDTQKKIAEYWWKDFLELQELTTDEHNTRLAFTSIHSHLARRLKKHYPADYTYIRNNLISYFRNRNSFNYQEMVDHVIGEYEPDSDLDVDDLKRTINELPKNREFDKTFQIVEDVIKAKYSRTISLDKKIKLKIEEDIENLENKIIAFESEDGKKYVKIESEKGYRIFKFK